MRYTRGEDPIPSDVNRFRNLCTGDRETNQCPLPHSDMEEKCILICAKKDGKVKGAKGKGKREKGAGR